MSHVVKKKQDDGLSFDGMVNFYKGALNKIKSGRERNIAKKTEGIDEGQQDE